MAFKYRADMVGSLLRPPELLDARERLSPDRRADVENRHILSVLERQARIGLKIFTDGEFRRGGFMGDFFDAVEGLGTDRIPREWSGPTSGGLPHAVTGKVRATRRLTKHEVDFLVRHAPGDVKMTLPSPNQFPAICYKKGVSETAYASHSEFLWDIVPIFEKEIAALAEEGVAYVQVDAPRYSYFIDPKWRGYVQREMGMDPDAALDEAVRADNACIRPARRGGAIAAAHLCRGNNRSQWYAEGGYDPIAEKLFNELDVDVFLLEYDTERAGTFEALRHLPKGKVVVLGLVSSKRPELESRDGLLRRIEEASRVVPIENLALSPQCGFASTREGNLLTEDQQWRKLERVVETAREVWPG